MMSYIRVISIFVNTPYIIGDNSLRNFAKKSGADGWGSGKNAYFCENLVKNAR